jgi:uncharacterized protein (TIGR02757 family)
MILNKKELKYLLDSKYAQYNDNSFIANDPISIPHRFNKKQDIEIAAFFASILAWGQRITIINNTSKLMNWMDHAPYDFLLNHQSQDLKRFKGFVHRTFNDTDLLYFIHVLSEHYKNSDSLENMFIAPNAIIQSQEQRLNTFYSNFFQYDWHPARTHKHIASPAKKSACKRLNMFLRWMVRKDNHGVDFGIWNKIPVEDLICPLDVHVDRVARQLGLISRKPSDWITAVELTENLKKLDPTDPVKYDYALFGLGLEGKIIGK